MYIFLKQNNRKRSAYFVDWWINNNKKLANKLKGSFTLGCIQDSRKRQNKPHAEHVRERGRKKGVYKIPFSKLTTLSIPFPWFIG